MKLMTKELEKQIPPVYSQENVSLDDKMIYAKFFHPSSNWTWYVSEYDPENREFFGYVVGPFPEWGYFSLDELQSVKGPFGLGVERDLYFEPKPFKEVKKTEILESKKVLNKLLEDHDIKMLLEEIGLTDNIPSDAPFRIEIKNRDTDEIEAVYYREDKASTWEAIELLENAINLEVWEVKAFELGEQIYKSDPYTPEYINKNYSKYVGGNTHMFAMQERRNKLAEGTWSYWEEDVPALRDAIENMEDTSEYEELENKALWVLGDDRFMDALSMLQHDISDETKKEVLDVLDQRVTALKDEFLNEAPVVSREKHAYIGGSREKFIDNCEEFVEQLISYLNAEYPTYELDIDQGFSPVRGDFRYAVMISSDDGITEVNIFGDNDSGFIERYDVIATNTYDVENSLGLQFTANPDIAVHDVQKSIESYKGSAQKREEYYGSKDIEEIKRNVIQIARKALDPILDGQEPMMRWEGTDLYTDAYAYDLFTYGAVDGTMALGNAKQEIDEYLEKNDYYLEPQGGGVFSLARSN